MSAPSSTPPLADSNSLQHWRLEQFKAIYRFALIGVGSGLLIHGITFYFTHHWTILVATGLFAALFCLFYASRRIARRGNIQRAISLFCLALIAFLVALIYFQRGLFVGVNVISLLVPLVMGAHLLDAKPARRIAILSAIAVFHNLLVVALYDFALDKFNLTPPPELPLEMGIAVNIFVAPIVIVALAVITYRAAERTLQSVMWLEQQSAALEETVRRRTAQLTAAADIGRAATGSLDLDALLNQTVDLIRDRFGYYHSSIFLIDDTGENAVVRASTGEIGQLLKERQHTLVIGSPSVIGAATAQRQPRVSLEVEKDAQHFKNPLLPETRSELGIPLIVGDRLLGALDVQSKTSNAFTAADVSVLQTLADQIAVAVNNAELFKTQQKLIDENERLLADSRRAIDELNALAGRLSRQGWQEFVLSGRGGSISVSSENGERPELPEPETAIQLALEKRGLISISDQDRSALAAPIVLRDQIIGALAIEETEANHRWSADDLALAQEVADRLGLALDNARLLEQVNLERERLSFLFEASRALTVSLNLADVVETTLSFAPRIGAEYALMLLIEQVGPGQYAFRSTLPGLDQLSVDKARQVNQSLAAKGIVQWIIENQVATVVQDTFHDPRWSNLPGAKPVRSMLIAPLRSPLGKVAGVLGYTHTQPEVFVEDQLPFIESISAQVSAALNNAQLYAQVERQRLNASALAQATQEMARSLNENDLMQTLADQLFMIFKPKGVITYRWNKEGGALTATASRVEADDPGPWPPLDDPFPIVHRPDLLDVMRNRASRIIKIREEPDGQIRESVSLPFLVNEQAEGTVELIHTGPAFSLNHDDVNLFRAVLTSAAFALQTARLYEQVVETAERLREVDRLKNQFLANMSHELRTPLNSIIGFSRVIMKGIDGPVNETQSQDLAAIHHSGQHLLGLINDILDLARIEAGKMELNFDRVEMPEIIKGVMSTTVGLVKDKPIQLVTDVPPNLPPIYADAIRIRQVMINLLSNASKFTDEGSITVKAQEVYGDGVRPVVQISVIDTGPGIPEKDLSKLFQTFSQVDGSATRRVGGSGLGLSICKNLVELHGGKIWIESKVGVGTTFHFTAPVYIDKGAAPAEQAADAQRDGYRINAVLAIDDDARLIDLYRRYLEPRGYILHGLINPREAVAAARALKPQVILLDVMMPGYDGWAVLKELKDHVDTHDIPVVICSILTEQEKARSMGAAEYLVKPILDTDLINILSRLKDSRPTTTPVVK